LAQAGITDLATLASSAGYTFQSQASTGPGGRDNPSLTFRGLQSFYTSPAQNSGALFVDGIFVSGGQASVTTVDIDHVEVLKGPQSTFFGRNTFGGAINFITAPPSNTWQEKFDLSGTARGSSNLIGTVEGPLIDNILDGRLTVSRYDHSADYKASDGGPLGAEDSIAVDGSLEAHPVDGLRLRFNGHYQRDNDSQPDLGFLSPGTLHDGSCAGQTFYGQNAAGQTVPYQLNTAYYCGTIPTLSQVGDGVVNANTKFDPGFAPIVEDNSLKNAFWSKVPHLDHTDYTELPYNTTASFSAGYNSTRSMAAYDVDHSAFSYFDAMYPTVFDDLTLDARLTSDPQARLRGLLGASYYSQVYQTEESAFYEAFGGFSTLAAYTNNTSRVPAVYGSIDFDIIKQLTLSLESRYQEETDKAIEQAPSPDYSVKESSWLPRIILRYKPIEDFTSYVSFARGVEPIDLNNGYLSAPATVKEEIAAANPGNNFAGQPKLQSFEFGFKQSLLDNRVNYSVDVFDMQWVGDQVASTVFYGNPKIAYTVDLPENAHIKGFELSTSGRIIDRWTVGVDVNYTDAVWTHYVNSFLTAFTTGDEVTLDRNKIGRVPAWTGALHTTYSDQLWNGWSWYARADVTYTGRMWESDLNTA
jgi:iron complex outermembrane receptor protein